MKKIKYLIVVLAAAICMPAASYAIVDIGAYGGYTFGGHIMKPEVSGSEFGVIAHLSFTVAKFLTLGAGAFYQRSFLEVTDPFSINWDTDNEYVKDSVGLDAFIQFNIPKVVIHPYGRVSSNIWDKADGFRFKSYKDVSWNEFFKTYSFGGGISFPIIDAPVVKNLHIYIEYLYNISQIKGNDMSAHTCHAGVRIFI